MAPLFLYGNAASATAALVSRRIEPDSLILCYLLAHSLPQISPHCKFLHHATVSCIS